VEQAGAVTRRDRDRLTALTRRRDWLAERINGTRSTLTYDRQEWGALCWAISLLEGMLGDEVPGRRPGSKPLYDHRLQPVGRFW
jgi:hypothetical protein